MLRQGSSWISDQVVDAGGQSRAGYQYTEWGSRTKLDGDFDANVGFTGHVQHHLSGLVLAPHRAYQPLLGRWTCKDPIAERGGVNLYQYVSNRPISAIDPLGLFQIDPRLRAKYPKAASRIDGAAGRFNYQKAKSMRKHSGTDRLSKTDTRNYMREAFTPGMGPKIGMGPMDEMFNRGAAATCNLITGDITFSEKLLADYESGRMKNGDEWLDSTLEHEFVHNMESRFGTRESQPNWYDPELEGGYHAPAHYEKDIYGWDVHPLY